MDRWSVPELFDLVRGAYPFRDLPAEAFERVLRLVSGRFPTRLAARPPGPDRLGPHPQSPGGAARLGPAGPGRRRHDSRHRPVPRLLGEDGPRLGELDEEFVFERRVGETFALGNNTWRIEAIEVHRVVVRPAEGHNAVMPFWRGEGSPRSPELGAGRRRALPRDRRPARRSRLARLARGGVPARARAARQLDPPRRPSAAHRRRGSR